MRVDGFQSVPDSALQSSHDAAMSRANTLNTISLLSYACDALKGVFHNVVALNDMGDHLSMCGGNWP